MANNNLQTYILPFKNLSLRAVSLFVALLAVSFNFACSSKVEVPVSSREFKVDKNAPSTSSPSGYDSSPRVVSKSAKPFTGTYIVESGDTLYSIAWRYGYDFKDVATWNDIDEPYIIYPGQKIDLKAKPKAVTKPKKSLQPGPIISKSEKSDKKTQKKSNLQPKPVSKSPSKQKTATEKPKQTVVTKKNTTKAKPKPLPTGKVKWQWPTQGKLVRSKQLTSKKGIDISGRIGQPIKAAAAGRVVYSGSGLLGYGRLIIIKHSETYLSAYAHNSELLAREGDNISIGQTIAKMGANNNGQPLLHFEIRKNGKSINPLKLLPKR